MIQFKIFEGAGLHSNFTTGSCAEFHFKPLHRLISLYTQSSTGNAVDTSNRTELSEALQQNTHIVEHYFDLQTQSYFKNVMAPVYAYWYRQEFAKSRGMVHWHGLCWRSDKQSHQFLFHAVKRGFSDDNCVEKLAQWAESNCVITAMHPAGQNETGQSRKDLWPPPEGNAPALPEDKNPLLKLLMDAKKVREKSRECHNHKPQPFPDPKRKRKPTNLNKHKPNKRTKCTKISSLFPKRGNRNTKRTEKHKNKMTHGKTYNKSPRRMNHKATKSKTNTGTTALERSVEQTTGGFKALLQLANFTLGLELLTSFFVGSPFAPFKTIQSPSLFLLLSAEWNFENHCGRHQL